MDVLPPWRSPEASHALSLTPHQREVALLIADGLTNQAIAALLGTTAGWVGTQVGWIVLRLGLACRADIAAWVIKDDLCDPGRWERMA